MEVSEKSVFPTSFGRRHFQWNLFSFENKSDLQISYLTPLKHHSIAGFYLAAVE